MDAKELLVGAYVRRDGTKYKVYRLDGTHTYRAYVNGILVIETNSKTQAYKAGMEG